MQGPCLFVAPLKKEKEKNTRSEGRKLWGIDLNINIIADELTRS